MSSGSLEFRLTDEAVRRFAELSGDKSSLHTDELFSRKTLYRTRVVHGVLPLLHLSLADVCCAKRHSLTSITARFVKPVLPGDRLRLSWKNAADEGAAEACFEFSVESAEKGTLLTSGSFGVKHVPSARAADAPMRAAAIVPAALQEAELGFEDIRKGDGTALDLELLPAHEKMLYETVAPGFSSAQSFEAWRARWDAAPFLAAASLSTLVGMRLPGRRATFMDFQAEFPGKIPAGRLRLAGTVGFKSESTRTVSVQFQAEGFMGKLNVKVNEAPAAMPSVEALKQNELGMGLEGKVVLITGASRGIGETTAKLFALHKAKVAVNYHRGAAEADSIAQEIHAAGGQAVAVQADVSDRQAVKRMVETVLAQYGSIDVLVNNAVRDASPAPFLELSWEDFQKDLDVTVKGAFHCCQEVLPHMAARKSGKIVNLSTFFTDNPPPGQSKYVVSKSALVGLTRSLAVEFAASNIQVNLVVPSLVETDLSKHVPKLFLEGMRNATPMKRHASASDVAKAVVFLASSWASFTTGQRIMVTGGNAPFL